MNMVWFGKREISRLEKSISELEKQLRTLNGERDSILEEINLGDKIKQLNERIVTLEIQEAKIKENHEREKREIEHMVGLQRQTMEFEKGSATKDAVLSVREESLNSERVQFEKQMDFITSRFNDEVKYLKDDIIKTLAERIPVVTVDKTITQKM